MNPTTARVYYRAKVTFSRVIFLTNRVGGESCPRETGFAGHTTVVRAHPTLAGKGDRVWLSPAKATCSGPDGHERFQPCHTRTYGSDRRGTGRDSGTLHGRTYPLLVLCHSSEGRPRHGDDDGGGGCGVSCV